MMRAVLGSVGKPLHILCLGAHSDDIEIGCGGTILRMLAERPQSSVRWIVFSGADERANEARASAAEFLALACEANVEVNSFRESFFPAQWAEIKESLERIKQGPTPDVIFCHHRRDLHQDHRVIAELSWNTFRDHLILEYEIPKYEGELGMPNLFVPLSRPVADRKVDLLLDQFRSQRGRPWFRADTFHGLMSLRGVECNASDNRAEAFHARKVLV